MKVYIDGKAQWIEYRAGIPVKVYQNGGCQPATDLEAELWRILNENHSHR